MSLSATSMPDLEMGSTNNIKCVVNMTQSLESIDWQRAVLRSQGFEFGIVSDQNILSFDRNYRA